MIKVMHSGMTGAPVMSGLAGAMTGLLYAALVTGFNSKTVTITRTGNTATATCNGHGFYNAVYTVVNISGANESAYNGDFAITNVTTNTFDFTVAGSPATPATGTITAKVAPIGWTREFSATNKEVYRQSEVTATRMYLRVDSTNTYYADVKAYETMSGIDTGTGATSSVYWIQSNANTSSARNWFLVSDGFMFYLGIEFHGSYLGKYELFCAGDICTFKAADAYHYYLAGDSLSAAYSYSPGSYNWFPVCDGSSATAQYLQRSHTQLGSAIGTCKRSFATSFGSVTTYPNPPDNGLLIIYPVFLGEGTSLSTTRGYLPGLYNPMQNLTAAYSHMGVMENITGLDRKLVLIYGNYQNSVANFALDITGPWR